MNNEPRVVEGTTAGYSEALPPEPAEKPQHKKNWFDLLIERAKGRESKRQKHIEATGVDPKTVNKFYPDSGVRTTPLVLSGKTRTRGGKNSRRRTARVWELRQNQPVDS